VLVRATKNLLIILKKYIKCNTSHMGEKGSFMKDNLPQRKHIRLKHYDYSLEGYYFITICTKNRECILSKIKLNDNKSYKMTLTSIGEMVDKYIKKIQNIYFNISIDEFIIMPNHIHIILIIHKKENNTVSRIIQQFKGLVTKELGFSIWQKLFHEHIIRNEKEYLMIKQYIINNQYNWERDKYY